MVVAELEAKMESCNAPEKIITTFWESYDIEKIREQILEQSKAKKQDTDTRETEYKTKKKVKGKQKDDIPNRFKGEKPYKGESGKDAAKRVLEEYGEYDPRDTGPGSDFNKLKKYFDTHFE